MEMIDGRTAADWVRALMQDDPACFKVGYTHENAVLAASTMFDLDDDETERLRADTATRPDCRTCALPGTFKPSHNGSVSCQSGSIASGGKNAHCTCDTCF